jgi:hypothetical protein
MLQKDPALRPGAIEVRQISRAIASDLAPAYEAFELSGGEASSLGGATRCRTIRPASGLPTGEGSALDADALEYGVTEMLPVVPKPRWTPEFGRVPSALAANHIRGAIGPRAPRDQVAGEILVGKPR